MTDFRAWLNTATDHPLLTREQERELFRRIEAGDESARELVITHNVRLAVKEAMKYRGRGVDLEDLVQEAVLGLRHATTTFDYRRGFKFSTHAVWWLRAYVARACEWQSGVIRRPSHVQQELGRLDRADLKLMASFGRVPSNADLAAATGLSVERVDFLLSLKQPGSLDEPQMDSDGKARTVSEIIPDTGGHLGVCRAADINLTYDAVAGRATSEALREALATLGYRARRVIIARYGLDGQPPQTLEAVARTVGSRDAEGNVVKPWRKESVRQLEQEALDNLRHSRALLGVAA